MRMVDFFSCFCFPSCFMSSCSAPPGVARVCGNLATLPVNLAQSECSFKHRELKRIRDERAEVLGLLVDLRDRLTNALETVNNDEALFQLAQFVHYLQTIISGHEFSPLCEDVSPGRVLESLSVLANLSLPSHTSLYLLEPETLRSSSRPSRSSWCGQWAC